VTTSAAHSTDRQMTPVAARHIRFIGPLGNSPAEGATRSIIRMCNRLRYALQ
jgi:hypothetical protein